MPRVPNEPIEIFFLPESSRPTQHFVRFVRRERFQRVHNSRQSLPNTWRTQQVNVIWHDDPSGQSVFLLVMKQQRVLHHPGHTWVLQVTTAMALIEISLYLAAHDRLGLSRVHEFLFFAPADEDGLRQRIVQAKCKKLGQLAAIDVWEITATVPTEMRFQGVSHDVC